jgi:chromosome segregation ATPase
MNLNPETQVIVFIALFTCIIISFLLLSDRIRAKEKLVIELKKDIERLRDDLDETDENMSSLKERSYNKIDDLHKEIADYNRINTDLRNKDNLEFLKALGDFNSTLTKFDTTLKHFDKTLTDLNKRVTDEIEKIKEKHHHA